jgi:hypothetical protein
MGRMGTILAERVLGEQDSGKVVRVSLGAPRPGTGGAEWECPFRIHGAGVSRLAFGYGIDSMQALTTALDGIRALLEESGLAVGWKIGAGRQDIWAGETGFARSIPIGFGRDFRQRMEGLLDRELERHVQRLGRRSPRTSRSRKAVAARTTVAGPASPARKSRKAR